MPEGLSTQEVGKEISEHASIGRRGQARERHLRTISILEAILLSLVALTAAWSGYAAAKWSTESRVKLAEAATKRSEANRANLQAMTLRNFDSSTFDAWFAAYTVGNKPAMALAERRFRPEFRVAFDAWRATHPETNPNAPKGPTYVPEYHQPRLEEATALDQQATKAFSDGEEAGSTSDKYVRVTVFLASVLFLIGISTQFTLRGVRFALVGFGAALLIFSVVQLTQIPGPP
ncbi:MAG TPA: hypothetical protein VLB79_10650 [Solirubrobacterales bacterium]|nr:hypothetical protein [Solirubrobacterales bacterium]